jgi:hypothetical protein
MASTQAAIADVFVADSSPPVCLINLNICFDVEVPPASLLRRVLLTEILHVEPMREFRVFVDYWSIHHRW